MKGQEKLKQPTEQAGFAVSNQHADDCRYYIRGDVFFLMRDGSTGEVQLEQELRNLVVKDASILIARLMRDSQEPTYGVRALAIGSGESGWNLQTPPVATVTQRALYGEVARKVFAGTQFINGAGVPSAIPTNVVDFTTTFAESEAVGPLVEMGLIGGNVDSNLSVRNPVSPANGTYDATVDMTEHDTLINYLTFPVINKPATSTLTIVWRLTF